MVDSITEISGAFSAKKARTDSMLMAAGFHAKPRRRRVPNSQQRSDRQRGHARSPAPAILFRGRAVLQQLKDIQRIGAATVIDAGVGKYNSSIRANHVSRRERKGPVIGGAILARNIQLEPIVHTA